MSLDPRLLLTLEAVARLRSFGEAGYELKFTQSAVSQQISELERQVGGCWIAGRSVRPRLVGCCCEKGRPPAARRRTWIDCHQRGIPRRSALHAAGGCAGRYLHRLRSGSPRPWSERPAGRLVRHGPRVLAVSSPGANPVFSTPAGSRSIN
jgi:Bacterial regulatory helix-turn-helix protein, lysR family